MKDRISSTLVAPFLPGLRPRGLTKGAVHEHLSQLVSLRASLTETELQDVFTAVVNAKTSLREEELTWAAEGVENCNNLSSETVALALYASGAGGETVGSRALYRAIIRRFKPQNRSAFGEREFSWVLYGTRSKDMSSSLSDLFNSLGPGLYASGGRPWASDLSLSLYGLGKKRRAHPVVQRLLGQMGRRARRCGVGLDEQAAGMALYGLKNIAGHYPTEARALHRALTPLLKKNSEAFAPEGVVSALQGLLSSQDSKETRDVVHAITGRVARCGAPLAPSQIGGAFHGIGGLGDSLEVRGLVRALNPVLRECRQQFQPRSLVSVSLGLRSLPPSPEAAVAVQSIALHAERMSPPPGPQEVSTTLFGLQRQGDFPLWVDRALARMVEKVTLDSSQDVSCALYGLSSRESVSVCLLNALARAIDGGHAGLDAVGVGSSLYGLHGITRNRSEDTSSDRALEWIHRGVMKRIRKGKGRLGGQELANALFGLSKALDGDVVHGLLNAIADRTPAPPPSLTPQGLTSALFGLRGKKCTPPFRRVLGILEPSIEEVAPLLTGFQLSTAASGLRLAAATGSPHARRVLALLVDLSAVKGEAVAE
eukprot:Hpha_TRINITY_DN14867_c4_g8::TRINITY_DN14867_c4_g8_i1::g.169006::m.169006